MALLANVASIPSSAFRPFFILAAVIAFADRRAAAILLACVPLLGIYWSSGQYSLPIAALLGETVRQLARRTLPRSQVSILDSGIGLLAVAAVVSVPFAQEPQSAVYAVASLLTLLAGYLFLSRALSDEHTAAATMNAFILTVMVSALVGIGQAFVPGFPLGFHNGVPSGSVFPLVRATGFFENPNTFAASLVLCAVVCLERALTADSERTVLQWAAVTAVLVLGIEVSLTRTAYVGLAVGVVVIAIARMPRTRRALAGVLIMGALLVATALGTGALERSASILSVQRDVSSMDRIYLGGAAAHMFRDHAFHGVGFGGFALEYPAYRDVRVFVSPVRGAHQTSLAIPAETGILGLLAEGLVVGTLLVAVIRLRRAEARFSILAGIAASIAFVAMSFFNDQHMLHSFWLAFALAGAYLVTGEVGMVRPAPSRTAD